VQKAWWKRERIFVMGKQEEAREIDEYNKHERNDQE
jgi:hypothetical protein